jgi:hypothetical protein
MVSMSINSNYLFVVNMDVDADKEALFNEIYDTEHIPHGPERHQAAGLWRASRLVPRTNAICAWVEAQWPGDRSRIYPFICFSSWPGSEQR